ncbi:uncharacterized protein [Haliotis asinina]|uniref:uncharacterized protein n=1 Tax=Haliotis asinina TaxID=109174 RepID=UPI00353230BE
MKRVIQVIIEPDHPITYRYNGILKGSPVWRGLLSVTTLFLSSLLAPFGKDGKSYISDSSSFVNQLKESNLTGTVVSYDVVDLFTNIPLKEALDILRSKLAIRINDLDTHLTIDSIINLARSCFDTSYFTFNSKIFKQIHGLPMGSPLSPLITEIFMTSFEEAALSTAPFQPLCWYCKVDDTFTTIANDNDPSELLNHINDQHSRIKFTMETETNQHLPFLVYRKPTHTDQYIHYNSRHHLQIKQAIIATLTRRAKALYHPDALNSELDHLRETFTTLNGYPAQLVTATINKTIKDREPSLEPSPSPIRVTIPYLGPISHQISRLIKAKASIDVTFSSGKTIKTYLKANGKAPSCEHPNLIPCNCGDLYIEETLRPINTRMKEQQTSISKLDQKSAISEHIL